MTQRPQMNKVNLSDPPTVLTEKFYLFYFIKNKHKDDDLVKKIGSEFS